MKVRAAFIAREPGPETTAPSGLPELFTVMLPPRVRTDPLPSKQVALGRGRRAGSVEGDRREGLAETGPQFQCRHARAQTDVHRARGRERVAGAEAQDAAVHVVAAGPGRWWWRW